MKNRFIVAYNANKGSKNVKDVSFKTFDDAVNFAKNLPPKSKKIKPIIKVYGL